VVDGCQGIGRTCRGVSASTAGGAGRSPSRPAFRILDAAGGDLAYGTVAQNSASDVFSTAGGVLTFLKAGTVTVSASMTSRVEVGEESLTLVRDHATDGTRLLAIDEVVSTNGARGTLKLTGTVKVLPGDRIRVYAAATTSWDLTSNGASSRINVQWTGVR